MIFFSQRLFITLNPPPFIMSLLRFSSLLGLILELWVSQKNSSISLRFSHVMEYRFLKYSLKVCRITLVSELLLFLALLWVGFDFFLFLYIFELYHKIIYLRSPSSSIPSHLDALPFQTLGLVLLGQLWTCPQVLFLCSFRNIWIFLFDPFINQ